MPPPDDALKTSDQRITWVLARPRTSAWLRDALRGARQRDPVAVLNELEILNLLLRNDCDARIRSRRVSDSTVDAPKLASEGQSCGALPARRPGS